MQRCVHTSMNRLLTWEFSRRCHSFVTVPIQIMFVAESIVGYRMYLEKTLCQIS